MANYYIDPVSDGGDGTTTDLTGPHAAFKSCAAATAAVTEDQSDSTLFLKRGSIFTADALILGCYGTADHPFTVDAYGEGDNPRICAAHSLPSGAAWTKTGGYNNVYQATTGSAHDETSAWMRYAAVWFDSATGNYLWCGNYMTAWANSGAMSTVTINAAGSGYTQNDVLTVVKDASLGKYVGTVTVSSVDGSGAVTGVTISLAGCLYTVQNGLATTGGTGTGCTINVTAIANPGLPGLLSCVDYYQRTCWWNSGTIYCHFPVGIDPTSTGTDIWVSAYRMVVATGTHGSSPKLPNNYININNIDAYYGGLGNFASCDSNQTYFGDHINFTNCHARYGCDVFELTGTNITATDCSSQYAMYAGITIFSASAINAGYTTNLITITNYTAYDAVSNNPQFSKTGEKYPWALNLDFGRDVVAPNIHTVTVNGFYSRGNNYSNHLFINNSTNSTISNMTCFTDSYSHCIKETNSINLTISNFKQLGSVTSSNSWSAYLSGTNGFTLMRSFFAIPSTSYGTLATANIAGTVLIDSNIFKSAGSTGVYNVNFTTPSATTTFINNTVIGSPPGFRYTSDATTIIKNNIFYNCTNIIQTPATLVNLVSDYNCAYGTGINFATVGGTGKSLAVWRSTYLQDANTKGATNPIFVNASGTTATDFKLQATSPCIAKGTNVNLTTDYAGQAWRNPPSIGAFEHSYQIQNQQWWRKKK